MSLFRYLKITIFIHECTECYWSSFFLSFHSSSSEHLFLFTSKVTFYPTGHHYQRPCDPNVCSQSLTSTSLTSVFSSNVPKDNLMPTFFFENFCRCIFFSVLKLLSKLFCQLSLSLSLSCLKHCYFNWILY